MNKATMRGILAGAILLANRRADRNSVFEPSGRVVQIEEAGLIGALIAGLSGIIGYYFKGD